LSRIHEILHRAREADAGRRSSPMQRLLTQPFDQTIRATRSGRTLAILTALACVALGAGLIHRWAQSLNEPFSTSPAQLLEPSPPPATNPAPSQTVEEAVRAKYGVAVSTNIIRRTNVGWQPSPGVDAPTRLNGATQAETGPEFRLQSVFVGARRPSAVINGEMLFLGDEILEAHLKEITPEAVTLERHGTGIVLRLPQL